jgi:tetratricopeptide (TPR) repeat protein
MSPLWRRRPPAVPPEVDVHASGDRSVAAGGDVGMAVTGDGAVGIYAPRGTVLPAEAFLPPEQLPAPPTLSNLPSYPRMLVGRADMLATLDAALARPGGVVVQAVHGLGGIGKSALAARWAADHRPPFTPTWWITADTPAGVDTGLAELAMALQPGLATVLPTEALRDRAVRWLASHAGWLVVLDNVTDPDHITALLARARAGWFLITSRRADGWHHVATPVRLDVLGAAAAVELLVAIITHDPVRARSTDGAAELCEQVGNLPLALEQIGAYCAQTAITPRAYLDLLARYPARAVKTVADGADPDRSIARVWRITLDHLDRIDSIPGRLLRILGWWAPSAIPRTLLETVLGRPELDQALGRLAAYSMINLDGDTISVHRLVQALSRIPDVDDPHRRPADIELSQELAATCLDDAAPETWRDPASWPTWRVLLPHIDALAQHGRADSDTFAAARLFNRAGPFMQNQGDLSSAIGYLQRAVLAYQRILGPDDPNTLSAQHNLAGAYTGAGDLARAIPLLRQILTDTERVRGRHHPETLSSRNNLASAYEDEGDLAYAIPMFEQVLVDRQRVLGQDHPDTLISRNNLAHAYQAAGEAARAVPMFEQLLVDRERILGPDHPDSLVSRNNLAYCYHVAGDVGRAVPMFEQLLVDQERILGRDHPSTLTSRNNLADGYARAGELSRAIVLFEQTLTDCVRVLGPDHPDTLASRHNLADVYNEAGNLDLALPLFEQTLADRQRVLGPDHPETLASQRHLASAYELRERRRTHPGNS